MIYDSMDQYIDELESSCHKMSLEIDELNNKIAELERENSNIKKAAERIANIITTSDPERTGAMFICGVAGKTCEDKLPEYILICPTYGLDGHAIYKKHTDYTAPGW
jgi:hypothetical protein